jgi:hypothetical protein
MNGFPDGVKSEFAQLIPGITDQNFTCQNLRLAGMVRIG